MIDHGAKIQVIDVEGWYDAGEQGTLLETNRTILEKGRATPADVGSRRCDDRSIRCTSRTTSRSRLRRSVRTYSIGAGSRIEGSELRDTIIGAGATSRIRRSQAR